VLKQRYDELGPAASRFLAGLIKHRRYGRDEAHKILTLLETYHRRDLLAAIERAVHYGAYSRSAIERILAVRATPKRALDALADKEQRQLKSLLGDEPVRPRSGKDYQKLLDDLSWEAFDGAAGQNEEKDSKDGGQGGEDGVAPNNGPDNNGGKQDDDDRGEDDSACVV
jgi:hypothetical protein